MKYGLVIILTIIPLQIYPSPAVSEEWTGYLIISRADGVQSHYLQLDIESRKLCKMLNKTSFNSHKINCPSCEVSFESCNKGIPEDFIQVVENETWTFPYISKKKDRIWFTGVSPSESTNACRKLASKLRSGGIPSLCIE